MVDIVFYRDEDDIPVWDWLQKQTNKVQDKCIAKILRLGELGHKLRRPEADYLESDIYELRIVHSGSQYRILYFFYGRKATILTNSFLKNSKKVPKKEIREALKRKEAFEENPRSHTFKESW